MKILITLIVIVVVLGLGWYFYATRYAPPSPASSPAALTPPPAPAASNNNPAVPSAKEITVEMTASGFSPAALNLKVGDAVKFVNKDSAAHWPASAPHPVHTCYPGFDARQPIEPGGSYSFIFSIAKTCGFHDHLNPSRHGSVTVK